MSVSPEVIHDVGVKVLYWLLLLISFVMLIVFIVLQVNHESKRESLDYDIDLNRDFYIKGMTICVGLIVLALIGLFP